MFDSTPGSQRRRILSYCLGQWGPDGQECLVSNSDDPAAVALISGQQPTLDEGVQLGGYRAG